MAAEVNMHAAPARAGLRGFPSGCTYACGIHTYIHT